MIRRSVFVALAVAPALAACDDEPTSPGVEAAIHGLIGGLEPGEAYTLNGEDAGRLHLPGGRDGAEYVVVPYHAADSAEDVLDVVVAAGGPVLASAAPADRVPGAAASPSPFRAVRRVAADAAHLQRLARAKRETGRMLHRLPPRAAARASLVGRGRISTLAAPQLGEVLELNVQYDAACEDPVYRGGRVVAVTDHAVVVADTLNPAGGFSDAEYQRFGQEFDRLIHPVLTGTFGEPTDVDGNERVIAFFTSAVNDLTPPGSDGVIAGFFYARDLFPRAASGSYTGCEGSNEAEIFYLFVPDPARAAAEPVFSKEFVGEEALPTLGHEYQHLINASRRLYVNEASDWEQVWLDEGLSHIAEELLFYAASGLEPGSNIDIDVLTSSQQRVDAANTYLVSNMVRYGLYLERPDSSSIFEYDLEGRGAVWAFLRYVADHDPADDRDFFHALANNGSAIGVANLEQNVDRSAAELARDWAAAVYADDAVDAAPERYAQPSWDFRSIVSDLFGEFPLATRALGAGASESLALKGGGAGFIRLSVDAEARATLTTTSRGASPPAALHLTVLRVR